MTWIRDRTIERSSGGGCPVRSKGQRGLFERIVRQPPNVRPVGAHHEDVSSALATALPDWHLVLEPTASAGERNPLTIERPRRVRVIARGVREALQIASVRTNWLQLPVRPLRFPSIPSTGIGTKTKPSKTGSLQYRHVPTGTLAVLAQRLNTVSASPSTWYRLVRKYGWRRPRLRVYPAKPKVGLRTTGADEMWHIDTTVIRLLDGTRVYLHAVIDNFSRRILAWRVADTFAPVNSVAVLLEASGGATRSRVSPS